MGARYGGAGLQPGQRGPGRPEGLRHLTNPT